MASRSEDVKTPLATISFAGDLFKLREYDNGGKGYGCTLIFPKTADLSALEKIAVDAAVGEWGEKARKMIADEVIKNPFLDGDGKQGKDQQGEQRPELKGMKFIRCKSGADFKPKVFDKKRNPVMDVDDCPSGSQVYGVVNAFTWENAKNGKGISFGISLVQVVKKAEGSEVLGGGGGPDPDKWLEKIEDDGDAAPETKDGKGAGGLFG